VGQAAHGGGEAGTIQKLARVILDAPPPSLAATKHAKLLLLDAIGCGLLGAQEAVSRAVATTCTQSGECLVFGHGRKASLLDAVFMNGVSVRALDFNDYLVNIVDGEPETGGHPSDNIPVALAVGSVYGRSGAEILATIVRGYELYARLQAMMDREGAWDNVSVSGVVAPAMAGILVGLDETQMAHALALGLSRAAMPAIVRREKLSSAKTLANALIAQAGVHAALLAEAGVTGPLSILDDALGLRHLFARYDPGRLTQPMPDDGAIMHARIKMYPCVNTGQGVIEAAVRLHAQVTDGPFSLSKIELVMPDYKIIARQQTDPHRRRPTTRETADHSFPFLAAVSLIDGAFGLRQFENDRWRDAHVLSLMEKIEMRRDSGMNGQEPYPFPCTIRATGQDGRKYIAENARPMKPSSSELGDAASIDKFHRILEPILPQASRAAIVDAVMEFDQCPSTSKLDTAIANGRIVS
jgi:2-methylcitrate dehydratase